MRKFLSLVLVAIVAICLAPVASSAHAPPSAIVTAEVDINTSTLAMLSENYYADFMVNDAECANLVAMVHPPPLAIDMTANDNCVTAKNTREITANAYGFGNVVALNPATSAAVSEVTVVICWDSASDGMKTVAHEVPEVTTLKVIDAASAHEVMAG